MTKISATESLIFFIQVLKRLTGFTIFLLVLMGVSRIITFFYYGDSQIFSNYSKDIWKAFSLGIRFDLSVLCYIHILPILCLFGLTLTRRPQWLEKFRNWIQPYYLAMVFLIGFILSIDFFYYAYFKDHLNILVFAFFEDSTLAIIKIIWQNYLSFFSLIFLIFISCFLWIGVRWFFQSFPSKTVSFKEEKIFFPWFLRSFLYFVTFFCIGLGARGSLSLFPLGPDYTVISSNAFLNYLSSNGVHALYRAIQLKIKQGRNWDANFRYYGYSDVREAFADYFDLNPGQVPNDPLILLEKKTNKNIWAEQKKPHVVVIMMESLGSYWLQFHSLEFNLLGGLEKHFKDDFLFKNSLPSAGSTIGSIGALLIGGPHRPEGPFLTESDFLQVPFRTSPARIFNQAGYETHFVYGGNPGWRDLNKFVQYQGFQFLDGEIEIEKKIGGIKERHDWGIYDEDVFKFVELNLKESEKPLMMVVLTTTNHPPYQHPSSFKVAPQKIPSLLKSRIVGDPKIVENRFRVYLYSTTQLSHFLDRVKTSTYGDKTLISVTGDHNFWLINFEEEEQLSKWGVPIYFYLPKELKLSADSQTFCSHMDIFPTLYNLSLSDFSYKSFGNNIFDSSKEHYAFYFSRLSLNKEGGVMALRNKENHYFDWQGNFERMVPGKATESKMKMATKYKSLMSIMDYYLMMEKKLSKTRL